MSTPLQIWLARQPNDHRMGLRLRDLLGSVWKSLWNELFPMQRRADTPEEALCIALDWAENTADFPTTWKTWLAWSMQDASLLGEVALELVEFCERRDNALRILRALPPPSPPTSAERFRDYRGVPCPLNALRARLELARMETGQQLRLLLDCGSPIENVPASLCADGHTITGRIRKDDFWELLVTCGHH